MPEDENDPRFAALVEVLSRAWGRMAIALVRGWRRKPAMRRCHNWPDYWRRYRIKRLASISIRAALIHHGNDPAEAVAVLGRRVLHVHACDAVRDLARGQAIDVELGRGAADLPSLLGRLEEFNYNSGATGGWVTIECPNSADPVARRRTRWPFCGRCEFH